jgi:hypothetical protein
MEVAYFIWRIVMEIKPVLLDSCDVCGKTNVEGYVVASSFGPCSNAVCLECLVSGKESYHEMVAYISEAGHWPNDINETYQRFVRRQLELHNKTEEQFKEDVERMIELCKYYDEVH